MPSIEKQIESWEAIQIQINSKVSTFTLHYIRLSVKNTTN